MVLVSISDMEDESEFFVDIHIHIKEFSLVGTRWVLKQSSSVLVYLLLEVGCTGMIDKEENHLKMISLTFHFRET